jgi:hypothetical protein
VEMKLGLWYQSYAEMSVFKMDSKASVLNAILSANFSLFFNRHVKMVLFVCFVLPRQIPPVGNHCILSMPK